jgi:hypothetical protein
MEAEARRACEVLIIPQCGGSATSFGREAVPVGQDRFYFLCQVADALEPIGQWGSVPIGKG